MNVAFALWLGKPSEILVLTRNRKSVHIVSEIHIEENMNRKSECQLKGE
jgi:hypothetical protein